MKNYSEQLKILEEKINAGGLADDIRTELNFILDEIIPIKENDNNSFSFDFFLDYYLFNEKYNKDLKFTILEEPVYKIYYLLALTYIKENNFSDAAIHLKKAIEWNPLDMPSYYRLIEVYNYEEEVENVKIVLFEMHKFIYYYEDLGNFYKLLGDYLYKVKNYEIANIVYCYAENFIYDTSIETKLLKIAGKINRPVSKYPKEECIKNLEKLKIPTNVNSEFVEKMKNLFEYYKKSKSSFDIYKLLKTNLFKLTEDELYEDTKVVKNNYFNFDFEVPDSWKIANKNDYNKNYTGKYTLYIFKIDTNSIVNFDILKDASGELLDEYKLFRKYITNQGYNVKLENEIKYKGIKYVQCITQRKLLNEHITMINCIFLMKGKLFNVSVPSFGNFNETNLKDIYDDKNAIRLNRLLSSIQES